MSRYPPCPLAEALDFSSLDRRPRLPGSDYELVAADSGHDGRQPALMFVAGGYHGAWCFAHYLDFFEARGIACYAIDLPGHGARHPAAAAGAEAGVAGLAASLRAACQTLARPLVLVGHSLGALPAMLAASLPDVAGLVLMAPSPPGNLPGAQALPALPAAGLVPPPAAPEIRRRFLGLEDDRLDVEPLRRRLTPESTESLYDRYLLRIPVDPGAIRCPGLCLEAGLDDPARHPAAQDRALAAFLSLDYRYLPDQPHCMMYGPRWRDSAQALADWYEQHFRTPPPLKETTHENTCSAAMRR